MSVALQAGLCVALLAAYVLLHMRARPIVVVAVEIVVFSVLTLLEVVRFAVEPGLTTGILALLMATWIPYTIYEYRRREAKP